MDTSVITVTTDRLRTAVLAARALPLTYDTAKRFSDDIEAALESLRHDLERHAPLECRLAGVYYALGDPLTISLSVGDQLKLRREPDNRADPSAVAVYASCGTRCGYLPRGVAAGLAPHLDANLSADVVVTSAHGTDVQLEVTGTAVTATHRCEDEPW